jgi:NAD(P)-dependent dehydrogenase (short-subunit alcohol dehydrogenase family)
LEVIRIGGWCGVSEIGFEAATWGSLYVRAIELPVRRRMPFRRRFEKLGLARAATSDRFTHLYSGTHMHVAGKTIAITGAGKGIGRALAERFAREGAKHVAVADLDEGAATAVAAGIGGFGMRVDVAIETEIIGFIDTVEQRFGPIDLFCSNAGIARGAGLETSDDDIWRQVMDVNLMAHVYAARALVPRMIARGGGYLLNTASAAGLLAQIGNVTYSVSKHAAVAFAEWLSITHGHQGLKVSILCPQAVRTDMIAGHEGGVASVNGIIEPEQVANAVIEGLAAESTLILPHPVVAEYVNRRAQDRDRWIAGMRRLQQKTYG